MTCRPAALPTTSGVDHVPTPPNHAVHVRAGDRSVARAVANDELRLRYQPIVRIQDRAVMAVEALVRWQHPTLGLLTPDRFFDAATRNGHMPLLDRWVLHRACRDMIAIRGALGCAAPVRVNVNISAPTLATDFTGLVTTALERTGLPARRLRLELCEGADLDTLTRAGPHLESLTRRGIGVALDDMGAGSTDLRYLSRLALHDIKIDKQFVAGMLSSQRDHAIVTLLTDLAHRLRLRVAAEGVETAEQLAALARIGVSYAQGYHLAPPLVLSDLTDTLGATGT
ncbi:EAL domain-containing protein [Asanoa sp. NPDC050611]|uniref:EAL domain-containing protein n=1 Tax=Asanoa sp. NPDC050611 TaxID=3157098 RepID=UPI0033C3252E